METNIDIVQGPGSRALFWVGTLGFDLTSVRPAGEGKEIVLGPNLFTGLGYRL